MPGSEPRAVGRKIGKFEVAHGGTIFLDEIGDITPDIQVKLLRVLEEREFMRLGGSDTVKVDVRVIAATNTDLEKAVEEGRFRSDLYYRLKVITLTLPPIRDRNTDIPLLVEHFLEIYSAENNKPLKRITPETMKVLMEQPWVGNVREIKNLIESLVVLTRKDVIDLDDLPDQYLGETQPSEVREEFVPGRKMSEIEKQAILETLKETNGNRSKAAEILGIGLRTLQRKLKEYNGEGGST
ncbi:sigma 54-interacting transcriptional regulator [Acidobacteriota bacterium]